MSNTEKQLVGLLMVVEEQQKAVGEMLEALKFERAGLAEDAANLRRAAVRITAATEDAAANVKSAASEAVGVSVRHALAGASEHAANALNEASRPVLGQLAGVVSAAGQVEDKLNGAVAGFGRKWALVAGGWAAGGVLAVLLAGWLMVWWQRYQVESLAEEKTALLGEVTALQKQANQWAAKAGRADLDKCGDKGRVCVRVDKAAGGYGKEGDYYVLRGY